MAAERPTLSAMFEWHRRADSLCVRGQALVTSRIHRRLGRAAHLWPCSSRVESQQRKRNAYPRLSRSNAKLRRSELKTNSARGARGQPRISMLLSVDDGLAGIAIQNASLALALSGSGTIIFAAEEFAIGLQIVVSAQIVSEHEHGCTPGSLSNCERRVDEMRLLNGTKLRRGSWR